MNVPSPRCGTPQSSREAEGLLIRDLLVKPLLCSDLEQFLKGQTDVKDSMVMECKKISLY